MFLQLYGIIVYGCVLNAIVAQNKHFLLKRFDLTLEKSFENTLTGSSLFGYSVVFSGDKMYVSAPLVKGGTESSSFSKGGIFKCDFVIGEPPNNCQLMEGLSGKYTNNLNSDLLTGFTMSTNLDNKLFVCSPNSFLNKDGGTHDNCHIYKDDEDSFESVVQFSNTDSNIGLFSHHDKESNCFVVGSSFQNKKFKYSVSCVIGGTTIDRPIEETTTNIDYEFHTDIVVYEISGIVYVSYVLPNADNTKMIRHKDFFTNLQDSTQEKVNMPHEVEFVGSDGFGSKILKNRIDNTKMSLIYSAPFFDGNKGSVVVYCDNSKKLLGRVNGDNPDEYFGFSMVLSTIDNEKRLIVVSSHGGSDKASSLKTFAINNNGELETTVDEFYDLSEHIPDLNEEVFVYRIHEDIRTDAPPAGTTPPVGFLLSVNSNPGKLYRFTLHKLGQASLRGIDTTTTLDISNMGAYNMLEDTYHFILKPTYEVQFEEASEIQKTKIELSCNWVVELNPLSLHGVIKFNNEDYGRLMYGKYVYNDASSPSDGSIHIYIKKSAITEDLKTFKLILRYGRLRYRSDSDHYIYLTTDDTMSIESDVTLGIPMVSSVADDYRSTIDIKEVIDEIFHFVDDDKSIKIYEALNVTIEKNEHIILKPQLSITYPEGKNLLAVISELGEAFDIGEPLVNSNKKTTKINMSTLPLKGVFTLREFSHGFANELTFLDSTYEWIMETNLHDENEKSYANKETKFQPISGSISYTIEGIKNKVFNTHPTTWENQIFSNSLLVNVEGWASHFPLVLKITKDTTEDFKRIDIIRISCDITEMMDKDGKPIKCDVEKKCYNEFHVALCTLNLKKHVTNNYVAIHYVVTSEVDSNITIGFKAELRKMSNIKITGEPFHVVSTIHPLATTIKIWEIALCVAVPLLVYLIIFIVLLKTGTLNTMSIKLGRVISKERSL